MNAPKWAERLADEIGENGYTPESIQEAVNESISEIMATVMAEYIHLQWKAYQLHAACDKLLRAVHDHGNLEVPVVIADSIRQIGIVVERIKAAEGRDT